MAKVTILKREDGDALEHLPALLESVRSIVEAHADGELSDDERETWLATTFHEYGALVGRNALDDIAATRGEKEKEPEMEKNVDVGALAMFALECAANNLRKANPALSEAQAFSKAYTDPANREAVKAEREASRRRLIAGYAREEPEILQELTAADIKRLVNEERRKSPFLDDEELYSRVEEAVRRGGGRTLKNIEVTKRDEALSDLRSKADELRKVNPSLTQEQAFAKVYRSEPALAARERRASRALYA